ncbi:hypothetical protein BT96DRAFT_946618 [Gymnopus androsaceus JB14]|uniref:Secreted protein n=1 Tax=Gymnopus androsaceus JB14 TaxID=1447944 RepID=A0A6A4GV86_9AGAR|nr:hypothetical protein BT96DRAFT_946618 [Gymnopus androsaceus JB14]
MAFALLLVGAWLLVVVNLVPSQEQIEVRCHLRKGGVKRYIPFEPRSGSREANGWGSNHYRGIYMLWRATALGKIKSNTPSRVPCEPLKLNAPSESEKRGGKSSAGMGTNRTSSFIIDGGCKVFKFFFIGTITLHKSTGVLLSRRRDSASSTAIIDAGKENRDSLSGSKHIKGGAEYHRLRLARRLE